MTNATDSPARNLNQVTLIYVPIFMGGRHRGAGMGPAAIRVAELAENLTSMGFHVAREIEVNIPPTACWWEKMESGAKCVPEIKQVSEEVAAAVEGALLNNTMPITIGGDHSLAIGSIAGAANYYRKSGSRFGLMWFDAHGDINTPDTTFNGNVHGMPLAVSIGKGDERLVNLGGYSPKVEGGRTALIGIRDLDPPERQLIRDSGVHAYTMTDIDQLGMNTVIEKSLAEIGSDNAGIHISFDIDVMDPQWAPGVTTAANGGLTYREAHLALEMLAQTGQVRSMDFVELNPANDVRNKTAKLAVELIRSSLGQRIL
ncbi:MAG: arginase [Candidatus Obscuribacterales bacterium]|nr:arginase [Candidatus Obscuribacterales bacterium]